MKNTLLAAAFALVLWNCGKQKATDPELAPTEITSDTVVVANAHNAQNSLDYLGIYKGRLPCADCAGIETSLELSEDFGYTLTRKYLGKSDKIVEQKGAFSWNTAGNSIVLDHPESEANQYFVGENTLTQLDLQGNKIQGKLANDYVLKKMTEAQAAKTDAGKAATNMQPITGIHWKLAEINGKPIKSANSGKDFFIECKADGTFAAFAGCNSMGGKYEIKDSKIRLFQIVSTMMACADMKTEDAFKKALETADNFVINKELLQLRKGEANLLKFDAIPLKTK